MDAALASAGNDPDGNKFNGMFRGQKGDQHFGFDFKVLRAQGQGRPGLEMNEPEAGLGVG